MSKLQKKMYGVLESQSEDGGYTAFYDSLPEAIAEQGADDYDTLIGEYRLFRTGKLTRTTSSKVVVKFKK